MARPKKPIDVHVLEKMAEKLWPIEEIAAGLRVSPQTIKRRYGKLIEDCRQRGKSKLRDLQWQRCLQGSDRMILHMGKHLLGQHDKLEQTITNTTNLTLSQSPALQELIEKLTSDGW